MRSFASSVLVALLIPAGTLLPLRAGAVPPDAGDTEPVGAPELVDVVPVAEEGGPVLVLGDEGPVTPAVRAVTPPAPAAQVLSVPAPLEGRVMARRVVAERVQLVPIEILAPPGVRALRAVATMGEVHGPERQEAGRFVAHLGLPRLRGPAVVLVLFETEGYAGCVRVPVWKSANLEVQTEPGAQVEVEIGGEIFGPVRAAGRVATVPVEIPPGAETARVVARDAAGNTTTSTINLPEQRFPPALVRPPAETILADDEQVLPVLVATTDENGTVPAEATVTVESGALGEPAEIQPGLRIYPWRPSRALGEKAIVVRVGEAEARRAVRMVPGPPRGIEIQAEPPLLPANGLSSTTVYAGVSDGLGHYIDVGPIEVSVLGGVVVSGPEQTGPVVLTTIVADRMAPGGEPPAAIVVSARAGGYEGVLAIRQFDPDARGLRLSAADTHLVADGASSTEFRLELLDGLGEPLPVNAQAVLSALGGTVPATVEIREGVGVFRFQAGTGAGLATVRAELEGARAHATVTLDPGPADHLRVEFEPDAAAGPGAWIVRARLEDRFGNGVPPEAGVVFRGATSAGVLGEFVAEEAATPADVGWMAARLALPPDESGGADLAVEAGRWRAEGRVEGSRAARVYAELLAGYVHDLGVAGSVPVRFGVGWNDAFGLRGFLFGAEVGYLGLRAQLRPVPGETWDVTGDGLTLYGVVGYRWAVASWLAIVAGLGAGMEVGWFGAECIENGDTHAAGALVAFSIGVRLAFGFPVGPGLIAVQVAYDDARFDDVVKGNVGGLGGLVGYRLEL